MNVPVRSLTRSFVCLLMSDICQHTHTLHYQHSLIDPVLMLIFPFSFPFSRLQLHTQRQCCPFSAQVKTCLNKFKLADTWKCVAVGILSDILWPNVTFAILHTWHFSQHRQLRCFCRRRVHFHWGKFLGRLNDGLLTYRRTCGMSSWLVDFSKF